MGQLISWLRRVTSPYAKILKGATRHGWSMAIPSRDMHNKYHGSPIVNKVVCYLPESWTIDHPDESINWSPQSSINLVLEYPFPDAKMVYSLRHYSLIKPSANVVSAKIVAPKSWSLYADFHLTPRIVMIVLGPYEPIDQLRLFLIDTISRTSRNFKIEAPSIIGSISLAYVSSGHLHIVFDNHQQNRLEFIDVKYALPQDSNQQLVRAVSSESISFPIGQRRAWDTFFESGIPIVTVACDQANLENNDAHICFTFDRTKHWRMETLAKWLASYEKTDRGAKILKAAKAISALSPPAHLRWFKVPAIREFSRLFTFPRSDDVMFYTSSDGLFHRWINPPSLKRLAAQAIFRAYPHLTLRQVEEATGVKISDGIPEDGTQEEAPVVYC